MVLMGLYRVFLPNEFATKRAKKNFNSSNWAEDLLNSIDKMYKMESTTRHFRLRQLKVSMLIMLL